MTDLSVETLLATPTVTVKDVVSQGGASRLKAAEEIAEMMHLVFPYRGVFVRHVGQHEVVADANQVLFFNAEESYRVSHPVAGGDASLGLIICRR